MPRNSDEFPFTPPPLNDLAEEKMPFPKQMEKLAVLLAPLQPPPPAPPPPTRWELLKATMRGRL